MNVGSYVDKDDRLQTKAALVDGSPGGEMMSYADLSAVTSQMGRGLMREGVKLGDVVMVMMPNCSELQLCYWACFKAGAIMQPLNFYIEMAEVKVALSRCRPKVVITTPNLWRKCFAPLIPEIRDTVAAYCTGTDVPPGTKPLRELFGDESKFALSTAGSDDIGQLFFVFSRDATKYEGMGVPLTHFVMEWHSMPYRFMGLNEADVVGGVLHPYNALTRAVFRAGATYVLVPEFSGERFLDCCDAFGITFLGATPGQLEEILRAAKATGRRPRSLKTCFAAGGLLREDIRREFESYFGARLYAGMGCKELGIFALEPDVGPRPGGTLGKVMPYMKAALTAADELPSSAVEREAGWLWIRSTSLIRRYWGPEGLVPVPTVDGWFSTGLEVTIDDDGFLTMTGRRREASVLGAKRYYDQR